VLFFDRAVLVVLY